MTIPELDLTRPTWGELGQERYHELGPADLEELTACQVCGSTDLDLLCDVSIPGVGVFLATSMCRRCTFVFRTVRPSGDWFGQAWARRDAELPGFHDQSPAKQANRRRRYGNVADLLGSLTDRRRLFDIGSGPGYGLTSFVERGWTVAGVEPDDGRARIGRDELGLDVRTMTAEELTHGDQAGVITIIHVFEHMRDPASVLAACGKALVDGGLLYIEVPDAATNLNWGDISHMEHLSYFSEWNLRRLALPHGLVARHRAYPKTKRFGNRHLAVVFERTDESAEIPPVPMPNPYGHYHRLATHHLGPDAGDGPVHLHCAGLADLAVVVRDRTVVPLGDNHFQLHSRQGGQMPSRAEAPAGNPLLRRAKAITDRDRLDASIRTRVNQLAKRVVLDDPEFTRIKHQPID